MITLKRISQNHETTQGVLIDEEGVAICCTVERPWLFNTPFVSCIPVGNYKVVPHVSPSKGKCFHILDVPGRDDVLVHVANKPSELEGCIAPGTSFWDIGVGSSGDAMKILFSRFADGFLLSVE